MRAYFFGNMYLSSIQQGIQAGHVIGEMSVKYARGNDQFSNNQEEMLFEWAKNHKTMILLSGGYGENLHAIFDFLSTEDNPYPFTKFHESEAALDGALTSVGVILPAKIYKGAEAMRKIKRLRRDDNARLAWDIQKVLTFRLNDDAPLEDVVFTDFEVELMTRLGTFRMAS